AWTEAPSAIGAGSGAAALGAGASALGDWMVAKESSSALRVLSEKKPSCGWTAGASLMGDSSIVWNTTSFSIFTGSGSMMGPGSLTGCSFGAWNSGAGGG